jgi:hypothetical protein
VDQGKALSFQRKKFAKTRDHCHKQQDPGARRRLPTVIATVMLTYRSNQSLAKRRVSGSILQKGGIARGATEFETSVLPVNRPELVDE